MISYLKGKVIAKASDSIILLAGNVGYRVFVSEKLASSLSEGLELELFCYLHLKREETMELYGVSSFEALLLFETLRGISGIGPKAALQIASLGTPSELKKAIEQGNEKFFEGVHGIGRKKVQKIILELTGTLKASGSQVQVDEDALDALVALGFSKKKAREALARVPQELPTQEKVKKALQLIRR